MIISVDMNTVGGEVIQVIQIWLKQAMADNGCSNEYPYVLSDLEDETLVLVNTNGKSSSPPNAIREYLESKEVKPNLNESEISFLKRVKDEAELLAKMSSGAMK